MRIAFQCTVIVIEKKKKKKKGTVIQNEISKVHFCILASKIILSSLALR